MRLRSYPAFVLILAACGGSDSNSNSSSSSSSSSGSGGLDAGAQVESGTPTGTTPGTNTLNGATIEVTRNGAPLKVEPKLADNDYGYTREFAFGKVTVEETKAMGDDEVGVVWSDGSLYTATGGSKAVHVKLYLKSALYEVYTEEGKENTELQPGTATKQLSEDKQKLVLYTYKGKFVDFAKGRAPTAEEFEVTIRNLDVSRKK